MPKKPKASWRFGLAQNRCEECGRPCIHAICQKCKYPAANPPLARKDQEFRDSVLQKMGEERKTKLDWSEVREAVERAGYRKAE